MAGSDSAMRGLTGQVRRPGRARSPAGGTADVSVILECSVGHSLRYGIDYSFRGVCGTSPQPSRLSAG
jgi:hypothetical protein